MRKLGARGAREKRHASRSQARRRFIFLSRDGLSWERGTARCLLFFKLVLQFSDIIYSADYEDLLYFIDAFCDFMSHVGTIFFFVIYPYKEF